MPRVRDILSALRAVAVWLLVVFVFMGPAGLGTASAFGSQACSDSCPCDDSQGADHEDGCDDEAADGHDDGKPPDEGCPEDCSCNPGVALTMVALMMPTTPPSSPDLMLAPSDAAAIGTGTVVFRPPRSRI
jgi:hypothetical protein